jgi:hypothetical protein
MISLKDAGELEIPVIETAIDTSGGSECDTIFM